MAGDKVLVLGATGPSGICVVRELVHRKQATIVYARNPSKLPEDLQSDSLVEVIKGEMTDRAALSAAISQSRAVISILGPTSMRQPKKPEFADYYRTVISLMREHGVKRILVMGTISIYRPEDKSSAIRWLAILLVKYLAYGAYFNIIEIQKLFEDPEAVRDIDWTVYRVGNLVGQSDLQAWKNDRELGEAYAGPVAGAGWTSGINRSVLAKWLVEEADSSTSEWIRGFPAVSQKSI